jgi:hypothetical protein
MERTKSEGLFGRDRLAPCGARRKRIRFNPNSRQRVKKKQKVAIRRSRQVGLPAKTGTAPAHFVARPVDLVAQVTTLWTTSPTLWIRFCPCGPRKRVSKVGLAVSAVALLGGQKDSCFYSWTLWITTLTLRVRYRPSGSAAIEPEGDQLLNTPKCFPLLSTGGQAKWREPNDGSTMVRAKAASHLEVPHAKISRMA